MIDLIEKITQVAQLKYPEWKPNASICPPFRWSIDQREELPLAIRSTGTKRITIWPWMDAESEFIDIIEALELDTDFRKGSIYDLSPR